MTIGQGDSYPGSFTYWPRSIVRDRSGRFIVTLPGSEDTAPWAFDLRGRFEAQLGRTGKGPGEFIRPQLVGRSAGDSLHIFDAGLGRRSVLTPDGKFVRSTPIPTTFHSVAAFGDGRWLVNAIVPDAERMGYFLHILGPNGEYMGTRGPEVAMSVNTGRRWQRSLAIHGRRIVSVPRMHELRIEEWNEQGELIRVIKSAPDWFRPYGDVQGLSLATPPSSSVEAIWLDPSGRRLWLLGLVADSAWKSGIGGDRANAQGEPFIAIADYRKLFDGVVEVYDLRSGHVIARQRFDTGFNYFIDNGLIGSAQFDAEGRPIVEVYRLEVH